MWSIGTTTNLGGREKFDKYMRSELLPKLMIDFPAENKVYDYQFDLTKQAWIPWLDTIE